jgi:SAM-dependent methyltransferase
MPNDPEFDKYAHSYEDLVQDPIRDLFSGGGSEFFHVRKRDLIRDYFRRRSVNTCSLSYLDVGCGQGELLKLLRDDFGKVCGCDPSSGMISTGELKAKEIDARLQPENGPIPFNDHQFDFVTAVCVYHHVPPEHRRSLTQEVCRVLKPGGTFAIIEHNPYNPITKLLVGRISVDADAILLRPVESRHLLEQQGLTIENQEYFLYLPEALYRHASFLETALSACSWIPLGGQYAVFACSH